MLMRGGRSFYFRYIKLLHFHHGLHDAILPLRIVILNQLQQNVRSNLPRQAKLVFEPSAFNYLAASTKFVPVVIHFLLRPTVNNLRYSLIEFELGTAIQRRELLTLKHKVYGQHASLRTRS